MNNRPPGCATAPGILRDCGRSLCLYNRQDLAWRSEQLQAMQQCSIKSCETHPQGHRFLLMSKSRLCCTISKFLRSLLLGSVFRSSRFRTCLNGVSPIALLPHHPVLLRAASPPNLSTFSEHRAAKTLSAHGNDTMPYPAILVFSPC